MSFAGGSTSMLAATSTPSKAQSSSSAADDGLRDAILQAFPSRLLDESSPSLDGLVSVLRVYSSSMTAEDLFYKTEAVMVSERVQTISPEVVNLVRNAIQVEWESKLRGSAGKFQSKSIHTPAPKSKAALGALFGIPTPQQLPVTPSHQQTHSSRHIAHSMPTPATPAHSTSQSAILETLNAHITPMQSTFAHDSPSKSSSSRVSLAIGTNPKAWNYRYMFERPGMKGQALDDEIEVTTRAILEAYGIKDDELADPSVTTQESVYVVGRIAPLLARQEADEDGVGAKAQLPRLSKGLVLEASRRIGAGSRTTMHLTNSVKLRALPTSSGQSVPHSSGASGMLGLYPGLIAGFRGRNGAGDAFVVEEILMPPALPLPATPVEDLMDQQYGQTKLNGEPLQVFVAAGPFTLDSDLHFTPWHRLMDSVEQQQPDVVLFMGPFLPANHAGLLDPNLSQMPQEIFESHIAARLRRLCDASSKTSAILLPSPRDIVSPHAAWPQPMFDKASLNIHKRVKCLPNPCVFSINEVIFGSSTADVLRDLRTEELVIDVNPSEPRAANEKAVDKDHMARLVRQVMHQRHFYPLFPASSASDLPLDVTHAKLAQFADVTPDVLLLPSILTSFAKVVDGTVVINPGQAAKGMNDGRGTFAIIQVQPMSRQSLNEATREAQRSMEDDVQSEQARLPHAVYERARVDISRI